MTFVCSPSYPEGEKGDPPRRRGRPAGNVDGKQGDAANAACHFHHEKPHGTGNRRIDRRRIVRGRYPGRRVAPWRGDRTCLRVDDRADGRRAPGPGCGAAAGRARSGGGRRRCPAGGRNHASGTGPAADADARLSVLRKTSAPGTGGPVPPACCGNRKPRRDIRRL